MVAQVAAIALLAAGALHCERTLIMNGSLRPLTLMKLLAWAHVNTDGGTFTAHCLTTWDLLRPRLSNPRTRKLPMTSAITDCMNIHYSKRSTFGLNLCCLKYSGLMSFVFQMVDVSYWNPSFHIFHIIQTWTWGVATVQRAVKESSTKTFELLLWSEGPVQLAESSTVENIPTALNTDVRYWRRQKILLSVETGDM